MTFLIQGLQKQVEQRTLSRMQLELSCASNKLENTTEEIQDLVDSGVEDDEPYLIELQQEQEMYDTRKESLESQIKLLQADIEALSKSEENGIKKSAPSFG